MLVQRTPEELWAKIVSYFKSEQTGYAPHYDATVIRVASVCRAWRDDPTLQEERRHLLETMRQPVRSALMHPKETAYPEVFVGLFRKIGLRINHLPIYSPPSMTNRIMRFQYEPMGRNEPIGLPFGRIDLLIIRSGRSSLPAGLMFKIRVVYDLAIAFQSDQELDHASLENVLFVNQKMEYRWLKNDETNVVKPLAENGHVGRHTTYFNRNCPNCSFNLRAGCVRIKFLEDLVTGQHPWLTLAGPGLNRPAPSLLKRIQYLESKKGKCASTWE